MTNVVVALICWVGVTVLTVEGFQQRSVSPLTTFVGHIDGSFTNKQRLDVIAVFAKKRKKNNSRKRDDDDNEMNIGPGMEDAFRQLEQLDSLDNDDFVKTTKQMQQRQKDEAFVKAMEKLNLQDILEPTTDNEIPTVESEVELYKDMASELSSVSSEKDIIDNVKKDILSDNTSKRTIKQSIDTKDEEFMNQAIAEAIQEAKQQNSNVADKESLLDNKELMTEIERIFDNANEQLLQGLEEIRTEQMLLARKSAEQSGKVSQARIEEEEKRMAIAEDNMKKMLAKVNQETKNVEDAIQELKRAQEEADSGIENQLVDLKRGGLIKQATLAGMILFTLRTSIETFAFLSGDPTHALPAILQGGLALVCFVAFLIL